MAYAEKSEPFGGFLLKVVRQLRNKPSFLLLFSLIYISLGVSGALYIHQKQELDARNHEVKVQYDKIASLLEERNALMSRTGNQVSIDIFKRLSFSEKEESGQKDALETARSLNSFAKYALDNHDFQKAQEMLDTSLHLFPTLEASYYWGILAYLQGDAGKAVGFWRKVAESDSAPADLFLYLAVAEYRAGQTAEAKRFAEMYSRSRNK